MIVLSPYSLGTFQSQGVKARGYVLNFSTVLHKTCYSDKSPNDSAQTTLDKNHRCRVKGTPGQRVYRDPKCMTSIKARQHLADPHSCRTPGCFSRVDGCFPPELIEQVARGTIPCGSTMRRTAWGILSQYKAQLLDQINGLGQYKGRKAGMRTSSPAYSAGSGDRSAHKSDWIKTE
jgi:hypothetical protein